MRRNLPSESFKIIRNPSGLGYLDIEPIISPDNRITTELKEIDPIISGYIIFTETTGIPIPDVKVVKREDIINRTLKVGFYNNKNAKFVYGTVTVAVDWSDESEDIWTFNKVGNVGTNPIVYKWSEKENIKEIDVVVEFVVSIKYLFLIME